MLINGIPDIFQLKGKVSHQKCTLIPSKMKNKIYVHVFHRPQSSASTPNNINISLLFLLPHSLTLLLVILAALVSWLLSAVFVCFLRYLLHATNSKMCVSANCMNTMRITTITKDVCVCSRINKCMLC